MKEHPRIISLLIALCSLVGFGQAEEVKAESRDQRKQEVSGLWKGGPCFGEIQFKKDGTFEWRHVTPGNNTVSGEWRLLTGNSARTLVATCRASDALERLPPGKTWKFTVHSEREKALVYQGSGKDVVFTKVRSRD